MKLSYLVIALTLFGVLMVGNASVVTASRDFADKWYYFKLQAVWAAVGLSAFALASRVNCQRLPHLAVPLFVLAVGLLILVLVPNLGVQSLGARRWLNLGFISFQPSEVAKLALALYLGVLLPSRPGLVKFFLPVGLLCALVLAEPDLGTAVIILGMSLVTYFGQGGRLTPLIVSLPLVAAILAGYIFISPYRLSRVKTFFNPSVDPQGSSYQVRQALIGLGSGGLFGVGLGQSRQKFDFLPEVATDSIFAVVAEELGLVGSVGLVAAYTLLVIWGLRLAKSAPTPFAQGLALALTSWLGLQAFINLSALVAILPFTGVPLPFISYGGSSLVVNLVAAGLLVNIGRGQPGYNHSDGQDHRLHRRASHQRSGRRQ